MGCLYSNWIPTSLPGRGGGGRGALPFNSKVIGMLVVFFRVENSDFGIFRVFQKILCRHEILGYFFESAHFPYRVKMKSFQKVFSKLDKIA